MGEGEEEAEWRDKGWINLYLIRHFLSYATLAQDRCWQHGRRGNRSGALLRSARFPVMLCLLPFDPLSYRYPLTVACRSSPSPQTSLASYLLMLLGRSICDPKLGPGACGMPPPVLSGHLQGEGHLQRDGQPQRAGQSAAGRAWLRLALPTAQCSSVQCVCTPNNTEQRVGRTQALWHFCPSCKWNSWQ